VVPPRCPLAAMVARPIQMLLALLFVMPATAANDTFLAQLRACRGVAVAASHLQRHAARRAAKIPRAGRRARTSNRPKRRPAISMINDDILRAVQMIRKT
jgi:hypothetical protein